jgi:hypothetical protein
MAQVDDMLAIKQYIDRTPANTASATNAKVSFQKWYNALGWYDLHVDSDTYDEARNRRKGFDASNGQAEDPHGLTTEQMQQDPTTPSVEADAPLPRPTTVRQPAPRPTIRRGSTGPAVIEAQQILQISPADGDFGRHTESVTREYQQAHGLKVDGVIGPQTWGTMLAAKPYSPGPAPAPVASTTVQKKLPILEQKKTTTARRTTTTTTQKKPAPHEPYRQKIAATTKKVVKKTEVAEAGIFSWVKNLPLWAKILGAVGIGGGVAQAYYTPKKK